MRGSKTYLKFILLSFFHPNKFVKIVKKLSKSRLSKSKKGYIYFFINLQLGLLIFGLIKVYLSKNSTIFSPPLVFFPTLSETLFLTPFIGLGFLCFLLILYLIAKLIGGVGSLKTTFVASSWLSAPLIFIWVPYLQVVAIIVQVYLLIEGFFQIHLYSKRVALVNILMPILGIYFFISILNSINSI